MRRPWLLPALLACLLLTACTQGTDWRAGQSGKEWKVLSQRVDSIDAVGGGQARILTLRMYIEPPVTAKRLERVLTETLWHIRHRGYAHASIFLSDTMVPVPVLYNVAAVYFHPGGDNTFSHLYARPDYSHYELDMSGVRSRVYSDPHRPRPTDEELIYVTVLHKLRHGLGNDVPPHYVKAFKAFVEKREAEELDAIDERVWFWLLS